MLCAVRACRSCVLCAPLTPSSSSLNSSCPSCPICLKDREAHDALGKCEAEFIRVHKDVDGTKGGLVQRGIWYCKSLDVYFTHPPLSSKDLAVLYSTSYAGQAALEVAAPRGMAQAAYILNALESTQASTSRSKQLTIVEAGCSHGLLISRLAAPGRKLVCFEPGATYQESTTRRLLLTNASETHFVPSMFDEHTPLLRDGIDVFLSSHVLEHVGDWCTFLSMLFAKMNPGGLIFTETPNHTRRYVEIHQGGTYHLTLPTPTSTLAFFIAAGFKLVDISLVGRRNTLEGNGYHIRSIFAKPSPLNGNNHGSDKYHIKQHNRKVAAMNAGKYDGFGVFRSHDLLSLPSGAAAGTGMPLKVQLPRTAAPSATFHAPGTPVQDQTDHEGYGMVWGGGGMLK